MFKRAGVTRALKHPSLWRAIFQGVCWQIFMFKYYVWCVSEKGYTRLVAADTIPFG